MPLRFQTLPEPRAGVAALRLDGTVARGDHRRFAAAAGDCLGAGARGLVLDLADLGSMSGELAAEIALMRRRLSDGGARMAVVAPSVVVAWFLRNRLGEPPLPECATVEEAAASILATGEDGDGEPCRGDPGASTSASVSGRARPSLAAVSGFLATLGGGGPSAAWTESLTDLLRRHGLGQDAHLLRCDGDRLVLDGHLDALADASGRLGTLLAEADAPLTLHELGAADLPTREQTFLRWCGADVAVPLKADGRLLGALFVRSGQDGGLFAYRPGELLGLGLLGSLIGARLAQLNPETAADPAVPLQDAVESLLCGV
ncbi:MAG: hypothetical protein IPM94_06115 [bacterium]|nr:hypothetical protein [bacterium]